MDHLRTERLGTFLSEGSLSRLPFREKVSLTATSRQPDHASLFRPSPLYAAQPVRLVCIIGWHQLRRDTLLPSDTDEHRQSNTELLVIHPESLSGLRYSRHWGVDAEPINKLYHKYWSVSSWLVRWPSSDKSISIQTRHLSSQCTIKSSSFQFELQGLRYPGIEIFW